jgi:glycosyltransferase involved in cell wall biosynthesis
MAKRLTTDTDVRVMNDDGLALLSRISVVIPVKDDPLIFRCVESVNEPVEIVIAANGSSTEFLEQLKAIDDGRVKVVSIPEPGIGSAYNAGINAAAGTHILLMDSDCVFAPTTLRAMAAAATTHDMVKGRVLFRTEDWQSAFTARARQHQEDPTMTGEIKAYSPPLLYRRDIVNRMGGYHFDDRLAWREDREFELRRRTAGLGVYFVPEATITHKPLRFRADLRSMYSYGQGQRSGEELGLFPALSVHRELAKAGRVVGRILRQRHPLVAVYVFVRYISKWIGCWRPDSRRT